VTGETLLGKVRKADTKLVMSFRAPTGLSEVRGTRTTVGGPNYLGGSVTYVFPSEIPPGLPPELPPDFWVSSTFNISDLKSYMGDEDEIESRTTPIQEEEDDEDITSEWTDNTISCTTAKSLGTFYPC
jgi:hypothetical protein